LTCIITVLNGLAPAAKLKSVSVLPASVTHAMVSLMHCPCPVQPVDAAVSEQDAPSLASEHWPPPQQSASRVQEAKELGARQGAMPSQTPPLHVAAEVQELPSVLASVPA